MLTTEQKIEAIKKKFTIKIMRQQIKEVVDSRKIYNGPLPSKKHDLAVIIAENPKKFKVIHNNLEEKTVKEKMDTAKKYLSSLVKKKEDKKEPKLAPTPAPKQEAPKPAPKKEAPKKEAPKKEAPKKEPVKKTVKKEPVKKASPKQEKAIMKPSKIIQLFSEGMNGIIEEDKKQIRNVIKEIKNIKFENQKLNGYMDGLKLILEDVLDDVNNKSENKRIIKKLKMRVNEIEDLVINIKK